MNYPSSIPSPYTMHQHPYPTRFHGGIWRRPVFGTPYVRQPLNIVRPSQMAGFGVWDTGVGVFRRPRVDGGGIFNAISADAAAASSSALSPTTAAYVGGAVLGFGLMFFLFRKKA